jgi:hypothetical protein
VTGWGAEQLTREELLSLSAKLRSGWGASARQARQSHYTADRAWRHFAMAHEMTELLCDVTDELIVRHEAHAQVAAAGGEPEAAT